MITLKEELNIKLPYMVSKFFKPTTGMSYYDEMLDDNPLGGKSDVTIKEYIKYSKGREGKIKMMPPWEYMRGCAEIFHSTKQRQYDACNPDLIKEYAEKMKSGDKFPILVLDYDTMGQEGRHRAAAVESIGVQYDVPVLIVKKAEFTDEEYNEYIMRRYGPEYAQHFMRKIEA